jgi:intein/homing endonuclease
MGQVGIIGGGLTDRDRATLRLGVRSGDFDENIRKDIVIATFQTLMNRIDDLAQYKFGLMMVDECIPVDSEIWTQDGVVPYEDLGYGQDYKRDIFQVWSRNNEDNMVNNGYRKIKTRMKHMYRTIVETGDELVCSLDHKVLTRKGDGKEEFVEIEKAKNIARSLVRPYDMRKECIMARVFGYVLGDGHIGTDNASVSGDFIDLERLSEDIKKLNYFYATGDCCKISEIHSDSIIHNILYGDKHVSGIGYGMRLGSKLAEKLVELGHPIGKKTDLSFYIPEWIMNGSSDIKREFLAGYLGAEATNSSFRGGENNNLKKSFYVPRFSISKRSDLVGNGLKLIEQFKKLFAEFGINVSNFSITDSNIRKDGTLSKEIRVTISNQIKNLRRYFEIGYRYCKEKEKDGETIRLFLRYIDQCNKERFELDNQIKKLYDKGIDNRKRIISIINNRSSHSQKDIATAWGVEQEDNKIINKKYLVYITEGMVSDILYPHKRDDGTDVVPNSVKLKKNMYGFDDWIKKVKGDFIFLDILRHEYRGYEQGHTLTVNNDHNYLVNGFDLVNCHHCPAQMFRKVNAVIRAPYKLGLSATIERLDGMTRDVFGQLGSVQSKVSIRELINRGILAEPRFQSPIIVDHSVTDSIQDSGLSGLKYSRLVKKKSAASQKKKDYVVNICKNIAARDRKFLLFTDYVNAEDVFVRDMYADSLLKEETLVSVIDQGMASDERSAVFNFLEKGDISGIVFGKLGSEGVNIPSVDVVVMANAIKCVSGDTLTPTDKGIIRAEDLEIVDPSSAFTMDPYGGSLVAAKINEFYNFDEEDTIRIRTLKGYEIEGSVYHRIATRWILGNFIYTQLSDINIGGRVLICGDIYGKDIDKNKCSIFYDVVVSKKNGRNKLYDVNIDVYHSFIAGGFINHNSPITFTQRVGRAMRRVPGKDWCDVYEVLLDLPTEMKWSHFNFAEYNAEGFQKLTYKIE